MGDSRGDGDVGHWQPRGSKKPAGDDIGGLSIHGFSDFGIEQRLLPPHGDNAHRILPGHLEVADRTAPVVPCAALATVAEPDAHRLLLGQHGLHRAVGIRDVQLAARDDGPAAQREHDAR